MNKSTLLCAAFASLMVGAAMPAAADDGWLTCKDGLMARSAVVCEVHGGVQIPATKSEPIDTRKGVQSAMSTPAATTKPKSQQVKSSAPTATKTKKKTASNATRNPTAKCLDGALYYSTERRGACSKHGGVDKWYGW